MVNRRLGPESKMLEAKGKCTPQNTNEGCLSSTAEPESAMLEAAATGECLTMAAMTGQQCNALKRSA